MKDVTRIKLKSQLVNDEGYKLEVYLDHLGYPTFGVGHLIRKSDPEYKLPVGTKVSADRVAAAFDSDLDDTIADCNRLYPNFNSLPEDAQLVIANMMFNLGYTRLNKFYNMRDAVNSKDWKKAAEEMEDSLWYKQVGNRAKRLVKTMSEIS